MKSVCFLFGSGADTDFDSHLRSGKSFIETLLCYREKAAVTQLLGNNQKYASFPLIHPKSQRVYIQTILHHADEARGVFGDSFVDEVEKYDNGELAYKDTTIGERCSKFYHIITDSADGKKSETNKIRDFFLGNAVFFDTLDEKFNSLRNIDQPNRHARQVINAYWSVFVQMMKQAYHLEGSTVSWYKNHVFDLLQQPQKTDKSEEDSYYRTLRDSGLPCEVVTTNYTDHIETLFGKEHSAYLHGKLNWFEDYKRLVVYDCRVTENKKYLEDEEHIIPFILIPSGVKPMICRRQLEEFGKYVRWLENSNILVVTGYRFNSEDNHINSIVGEWLRGGINRKLIYLNWCGDSSQERESVMFEKLHWCSDMEIFTMCAKNQEGLHTTIDYPLDKRIYNVLVTKETAHQVFSDIVNRLKTNCES